MGRAVHSRATMVADQRAGEQVAVRARLVLPAREFRQPALGGVERLSIDDHLVRVGMHEGRPLRCVAVGLDHVAVDDLVELTVRIRPEGEFADVCPLPKDSANRLDAPTAPSRAGDLPRVEIARDPAQRFRMPGELLEDRTDGRDMLVVTDDQAAGPIILVGVWSIAPRPLPLRSAIASRERDASGELAAVSISPPCLDGDPNDRSDVGRVIDAE
ncbi:MAG: hypothetical protein WED34_04760 [Planctomycetales bacterium]